MKWNRMGSQSRNGEKKIKIPFLAIRRGERDKFLFNNFFSCQRNNRLHCMWRLSPFFIPFWYFIYHGIDYSFIHISIHLYCRQFLLFSDIFFSFKVKHLWTIFANRCANLVINIKIIINIILSSLNSLSLLAVEQRRYNSRALALLQAEEWERPT